MFEIWKEIVVRQRPKVVVRQGLLRKVIDVVLATKKRDAMLELTTNLREQETNPFPSVGMPRKLLAQKVGYHTVNVTPMLL